MESDTFKKNRKTHYCNLLTGDTYRPLLQFYSTVPSDITIQPLRYNIHLFDHGSVSGYDPCIRSRVHANCAPYQSVASVRHASNLGHCNTQACQAQSNEHVLCRLHQFAHTVIQKTFARLFFNMQLRLLARRAERRGTNKGRHRSYTSTACIHTGSCAINNIRSKLVFVTWCPS